MRLYSVMRKLLSEGNEEADLAQANDPSTPDHILDQLVTHKDPNVRAAAVGNPNIKPQTLLAHSVKHPEAALNNPLWPMAELEDPRFAAVGIAINPKSSPAVLGDLGSKHIDIPDHPVNHALAVNPNTPPHHLARLAAYNYGVSDNPYMKRAEMEDPNGDMFKNLSDKEAFSLTHDGINDNATNPYIRRAIRRYHGYR